MKEAGKIGAMAKTRLRPLSWQLPWPPMGLDVPGSLWILDGVPLERVAPWENPHIMVVEEEEAVQTTRVYSKEPRICEGNMESVRSLFAGDAVGRENIRLVVAYVVQPYGMQNLSSAI